MRRRLWPAFSTVLSPGRSTWRPGSVFRCAGSSTHSAGLVAGLIFSISGGARLLRTILRASRPISAACAKRLALSPVIGLKKVWPIHCNGGATKRAATHNTDLLDLLLLAYGLRHER